MSQAIVVFSTCASREEAERIARAIVGERLAACVQLLPAIQSIYHWQGEVEQSDEILMLFKTTSERFPALQRRVEELHSYQTPEIIAVPVTEGAEKYLTWLRDAVDSAESISPQRRRSP